MPLLYTHTQHTHTPNTLTHPTHSHTQHTHTHTHAHTLFCVLCDATTTPPVGRTLEGKQRTLHTVGDDGGRCCGPRGLLCSRQLVLALAICIRVQEAQVGVVALIFAVVILPLVIRRRRVDTCAGNLNVVRPVHHGVGRSDAWVNESVRE